MSPDSILRISEQSEVPPLSLPAESALSLRPRKSGRLISVSWLYVYDCPPVMPITRFERESSTHGVCGG